MVKVLDKCESLIRAKWSPQPKSVAQDNDDDTLGAMNDCSKKRAISSGEKQLKTMWSGFSSTSSPSCYSDKATNYAM
ncbi:hypothetical protein TYRP_006675 [Tyrophagus putrescentiae]|nr:hypothetical protein TYRP_006675 [Tyrophagus putrescentiae]